MSTDEKRGHDEMRKNNKDGKRRYRGEMCDEKHFCNS